jgi:MinD superfamily P-loop ATPase
MVIAIASGKGGTGKTTVATNLAALWHRAGSRVWLLDCDVEEPNCHLFLAPTIEQERTVSVPVPSVDAAKCNHCGACGQLCQYGAIVNLDGKVAVFHDLCHSCGGCTLVCPEHAITETPRPIGVIHEGNVDGITLAHGYLNVGEARAVPVIAELKSRIPADAVVLIDAPPGASCPMIEALKGSDLVCLVTEPTPFGLSDLRMAVGAARVLGLPTGVVINRADVGDDRIRRYCSEEQIPILGEIPNERRLAEAYSRGQLAIDAVPRIKEVLESIAATLERQVGQCVN